MIPDSAVFAVMPKVNKIFIGTRAVMANGGLIAYNGTFNLCLSANIYSIPVIVVGGSFKLTPMYPFGHETFNESISPDKIFNVKFDEDISCIKFNTPAFDYVPPDLVSIYLTDHGCQNPAYIYRMFAEMYSQEDYFL